MITKTLNSFNDLLTMDLPDIQIEESELIEGEIDVYVSLVFNKKTKEYYIEFIDMEIMEDSIYPIEDIDNFKDLKICGVTITKEIFNNFRDLVREIENEK